MLDHANKRSEQRHKVLKEGKLLLRPPTGTIDVVIKDLSASGARLEILSSVDLPENFSLVLISAATVTPCRLCWRRGMAIGVKFTGPPRKSAIRRF